MATKKPAPKTKDKKAKAPKASKKTETTTRSEAVSGTETRGTEIGRAREINASEIGPIERVTAEQMAPIERVQAEQIDRAQQEEFRRRQLEFADRLAAQTRGEGPSLAAGQYQAASDRAIASQMALARSGGGALARRQAQINSAGIQQEAARQSGLLRMAEALQAQQALGGVLEQGRGADINLATNQAQLNQQAGITNAGAYNLALAQQAQLNQNANIANASNQNAMLTNQAQLAQQAAISNQAAFNARNLSQADINRAIQQSRIAAGASVAAAGAGAAASRYATDAGLYKFNQELAFEMDRYYQGQGRQDVNSNYGIGNDLVASDRASRGREASGYEAAANAVTRGVDMPTSFRGG